MGLKDAMFKRFLGMALEFLKDEMPRLKEDLCRFSDECAAKTENEWDDLGAEVLRALLGCPKQGE